MAELKYNGSVVNASLQSAASINEKLSSLASDIKSATNQIVSAKGFNEYVGGISSDTFSSYILACQGQVTSLISSIRQMQVQILAYSQDTGEIRSFLDSLNRREYSSLDLSGIEEFIPFSYKAKNLLKGAAATAATGALSFAEGVLDFAETGADLLVNGASILATPFTEVYDLINGTNTTDELWADTRAFVSEKHAESVFNSFYENTSIGQDIKNNAYAFDTVRAVGNGIGYTAGVVGVTVLTGGLAGGTLVGAATPAGMAAVGGLAGFGKGTEDAWSEGASTKAGLVSGVATGAWEAAQWYAGGKISGIGAGTAGNTFKNAATRVGLDTLDAAAEGFVQPALTTVYKDYGGSNALENYKNAFDAAGGWGNVATQAAIGGVASGAGETPSIRSAANVLTGNSTKTSTSSAPATTQSHSTPAITQSHSTPTQSNNVLNSKKQSTSNNVQHTQTPKTTTTTPAVQKNASSTTNTSNNKVSPPQNNIHEAKPMIHHTQPSKSSTATPKTTTSTQPSTNSNAVLKSNNQTQTSNTPPVQATKQTTSTQNVSKNTNVTPSQNNIHEAKPTIHHTQPSKSSTATQKTTTSTQPSTNSNAVLKSNNQTQTSNTPPVQATKQTTSTQNVSKNTNVTPSQNNIHEAKPMIHHTQPSQKNIETVKNNNPSQINNSVETSGVQAKVNLDGNAIFKTDNASKPHVNGETQPNKELNVKSANTQSPNNTPTMHTIEEVTPSTSGFKVNDNKIIKDIEFTEKNNINNSNLINETEITDVLDGNEIFKSSGETEIHTMDNDITKNIEDGNSDIVYWDELDEDSFWDMMETDPFNMNEANDVLKTDRPPSSTITDSNNIEYTNWEDYNKYLGTTRGYRTEILESASNFQQSAVAGYISEDSAVNYKSLNGLLRDRFFSYNEDGSINRIETHGLYDSAEPININYYLSEYGECNFTLGEIVDLNKKAILEMDTLLRENPLQENMITYRGLPKSTTAKRVFGIDPKEVSFEEFRDTIVGTNFQDSGFLSTSVTRESAPVSKASKVIMQFYNKKGTPALDIERFGGALSEQEVLIAPNTKYTITDVTNEEGKYVVHCEIAEDFNVNEAAQTFRNHTEELFSEYATKVKDYENKNGVFKTYKERSDVPGVPAGMLCPEFIHNTPDGKPAT